MKSRTLLALLPLIGALAACGSGTPEADPTGSPIPTLSTPSTPSTASAEPTDSTTEPSSPAIEGAAYVRDGVVHLPDGGTLHPRVGPIRGFARLSDGRYVFAVAKSGGASWQATITDENGKAEWHGPMAYRLVVSADHSQVAWITPKGVPTYASSHSDGVVALSKVPGTTAEVVSIQDGVLVGETMMKPGYKTTTWTAGGGGLGSGPKGVLGVRDTSSVGWTAMTKLSDDGSCWRLWKNDAWVSKETCDYTLDQFSPDARYVSTLPAYLDGYGPTGVTINAVDDIAKPVASFPKNRTYFDICWEDATHLVAVADIDQKKLQLVRLGVDGKFEIVTPLGNTSFDSERTAYLESCP